MTFPVLDVHRHGGTANEVGGLWPKGNDLFPRASGVGRQDRPDLVGNRLQRLPATFRAKSFSREESPRARDACRRFFLEMAPEANHDSAWRSEEPRMRSAMKAPSRSRSSDERSTFQKRWSRRLGREAAAPSATGRAGWTVRRTSDSTDRHARDVQLISHSSTSLTAPSTTRRTARVTYPPLSSRARACEAVVGLIPATRATARADRKPKECSKRAARTSNSFRPTSSRSGTKPRSARRRRRSSSVSFQG